MSSAGGGMGSRGVVTTQPGASANPTVINFNNCKKIFVQRDYSEGCGVRFLTRFPSELEGRIDQQQFEFTVNMMNNMYAEAEKANCSTFCEGCMACVTAYVIYFCSETHYEKCLRKVARFVVEQNEEVWTKRGLLITDPIERGLRVIEISLLTEPATSPVGTNQA
ncbi:golgin subfamily A member 7-like [Tigriopus californicus]|uniref:golgin subfamily A member 7-like n=1 Tax=Tigriopus californicus TaxID=6832 RepID=UPI0027DA0E93|nr:golgin subfamily A member 7-like [Tigriopus californicus]